MKKVGKPVFFIVVLLIAAITTLAFTGVHTQNGDNGKTYIKGAGDIRWGIDIRGGVDVTFSPSGDYQATREEMSAAEAVIKLRLVSQNITDYEVYTDYNRGRIIVRFPWKADETEFNPEKAVQELGETAHLTFREVQNYTTVEGVDGLVPDPSIEDPIVIEGKDVESAEAWLDENNKPLVLLDLKPEGQAAFAEATARLAGYGYIGIWMDDTMISCPFVSQAIPSGGATITGSGDVATAAELADRINAGALPFKLETDNYNSISPTLGTGARDAMVLAGIIAFAVIFCFMVSFYRLPGFIAMIGLTGQVGLIIASISGFFPAFPSFTLTLPGIAGIILSIGFGVDANVITAERIKEELKAGKTLDGAVNSGCKRAFTAILDGNITIIIVAIILLGAFGPPNSMFGTLLKPVFFMFGPSTAGNIYSFGYTLLMGVLFNFVMSIFAVRMMLKSACRFRPFQKLRLYGGEK